MNRGGAVIEFRTSWKYRRNDAQASPGSTGSRRRRFFDRQKWIEKCGNQVSRAVLASFVPPQVPPGVDVQGKSLSSMSNSVARAIGVNAGLQRNRRLRRSPAKATANAAANIAATIA